MNNSDQEKSDNQVEDEGDYLNLDDSDEENLENIENNEKNENIEEEKKIENIINEKVKEKNKEENIKNVEDNIQNNTSEQKKKEKINENIDEEIKEQRSEAKKIVEEKVEKKVEKNEEKLVEEIKEEKAVKDRKEEKALEEIKKEKLVEEKNKEKLVEKKNEEKAVEVKNKEILVEEKNKEILFEEKNEENLVEEEIKKENLLEKPKPVKEERFLSNFKDTWIELVKISYPKEKPGFFNSYMVYEIEFTINGETFKISRRFSDFVNLRQSLIKFVPCVFIKNVHKKKIFNNKNANFILERVNSLEVFINFILEKKEFFNTEPFWTFFDLEKKESEVSDDLKLILRPRISSILKNYLNIFPDYNEDDDIDKKKIRKIKKYKKKVEINVEFYQQLSDMAHKIVLQNGDIQKHDLENFYNSIIVPFGKDIENFKKLKEQCDKIHKINLQEFIINFQKEIERISLDFSAFLEIFDDYETCERLYKDKKNKIILLKQNLSDLQEPQDGDITDQVENQLEITKLEYDIKKSQVTLNKVEKLFEIFCKILYEFEIPFIKKRKKINYAKNLNILAHQKYNLFNEQLAFWEDLEKLTQI